MTTNSPSPKSLVFSQVN